MARGAGRRPRPGAGVDVGDGRVSAAQYASPRNGDSPSIRPGTVFQRPFPTGDPEIAGFEGDTPDRRATARNRSQGRRGAPTDAPKLGRRTYEKGLLTIVWRAEDESQDELRYDVLYRRESETTWKPLKRELPDSILVWDTTSVPNGRYTVQIVASDVPSNSPETTLTASMESTTFEIDNLPPAVTVTAVRREGNRTVIAFDVQDADSAVQKAEYSLDGDRWQSIYPRDGIADSRAEQFELVLEGETAAAGVNHPCHRFAEQHCERPR